LSGDLTIHIIGAGPSGSSLAWFLRNSGYRVIVYEVMSKPGLKACASGVPWLVEEYVRIPRNAVVNEISGYAVYIDGECIVDSEGEYRGFIVDKSLWLKKLLDDSGAEVRFKTRADGLKPDIKNVVVHANGHFWSMAPRRRIKAVNMLVANVKIREPTVIQAWFRRELLGYQWVFPLSSDKAYVGAGGYHSFNELLDVARRFVVENKELSMGRVKWVRGSEIVLSGFDEKLLKLGFHEYAVGEAVGAVYPLTGEGIRPSIITSWAVSRELLGVEKALDALYRIGFVESMETHKRILGVLRRLKPADRMKLMKRISSSSLVEVGLGLKKSFSVRNLIRV